MYAALVWAKPRIQGQCKAHDLLIRKHNDIQRRAGSLISGALRTTSVDALSAELYLTPMPQGLQLAQLWTLTRTATLPRYAQIRRHWAFHRKWTFHTPLDILEEDLLLQSRVEAMLIETRWPFVVPPWWEPRQFPLTTRKTAPR
jgi:hypothetical protein